MRTMLRSKATLLFMTLGLLLAMPAVALADLTLDTSATLATDTNLPTNVDVGDNTFQIKVWRGDGNVGSNKDGKFRIVNEYNMNASGTITPDSTKYNEYDWSNLSCGGQNPPQGCTLNNPVTVNAKLIVAAGAEGKKAALTISQSVVNPSNTGIKLDPTPASGWVQVAAPQMQDQTISFAANTPTTKTFGDPNFNVSATATSGLDVSFAAKAGSNCTVSNVGLVSLTGAGTCTVVASQSGNTSYNAAPNVEHAISIGKATPTITWNPQALTYGTGLGTNQLNASASGVGGGSLAGNFVYNPGTGTVLDAGQHALSASFTPTNTTDYSSVPNAQAQLTVNKAALSVTADNQSKYYGDPNPTLTGTLTGVVNGDKITDNYKTQATQNSLAGNYDIVPQLVDPDNRLGNYSVSSTNGTLRILAWSPSNFFRPIDMSTATTTFWNSAKGGSTIPVKFEIFKIAGDASSEKKDPADVKSIQIAKVACTAGVNDPINAEELVDAAATGQTGLRFDANDDQFVYNWATPKVSANTCYKLTMTTADGTSQTSAFFQLRAK